MVKVIILKTHMMVLDIALKGSLPHMLAGNIIIAA